MRELVALVLRVVVPVLRVADALVERVVDALVLRVVVAVVPRLAV